MKIKIGKHEYDEKNSESAEFSRFYLEQDSQKSNVYFASVRGAPADPNATLYYKVLSGKVVYKKSRFKTAISLAVLLMIVSSFSALFIFSSHKVFVASDHNAPIKMGFDNILSAQKALAELRVNRAFFDFHAAYQSFQSIQVDNSYLSGLALSFAEYFPFMVPSGGDKEKIELELDIARAGMAITKSVEPILKIFRGFTPRRISGEDTDQSLDSAFPVALSEMRSAQGALNDIQKKLENSGEDSFLGVASRLHGVSDSFSGLISAVDFVGWALGIDHQRNFVVVVQNTGRSGATGGAITSVGLITIEGGYITKTSFDDVYNIDGQLQMKVIPPVPIQKVDTVWGLHNANWFLDFPTSAKKIAYFYQKSQGISPDGVIAINDNALKSLLKLIGPIDLLKYDLTIDNDNFNHLTALNIADEKRASQAKRVFNDVASSIFEKSISLPENKMENLLSVIKENTSNKDMLVWVNEEKYESIVTGAHWGGEILAGSPDSDYLAVVATDINEAGSGFTKALNINKQTEITDRGEAINVVAVERKRLENELPVGKEKKEAFEYIRLYVPDGSELISASGMVVPVAKISIDYAKGEFKTDQDVVFSEQVSRIDPESGTRIFRESGKTVFGAWLNVSSGDQAIAIFKYKLPFLVKRQDDLNFIFQKQPGVDARLDFKAFKSEGSENIFSYNGNFSTDLFFNAANPLSR